MTSGPQPPNGYGPPQPWQSGGPYPPPPSGGGRRKGIGIIAAVIAVVLLIGAGVAVVALVGGSDDSSSADDEPSSSDDPTSSSDGPSEPSSTDAWEAIASDAEVNAVADALETADYACYDTLATPVLVRRCFLDPATTKYDEQTVTIQAAPDGSVNTVDVEVDYLLSKRKAESMFTKTLRAIEGTIVGQSEVSAILGDPRPGRHVRHTLNWGRGDLFVDEDSRSYDLELVASGADHVVLPTSDTAITVTEVKRRFSQQGFSCKLARLFKGLECQRRVRGGAMSIVALDDCIDYAPKLEDICKGHKVTSLAASAEFDSGMPEAAYQKFYNHLQDGFNIGARDDWSGEAVGWFTESMSLLDKRRADFDGMHVEIMPGYGAVVGGFEQAYEVTVSGLNLTA